MRFVLVITLSCFSLLNVFGQSELAKFQQEMKKIETEEGKYRDVIWGKDKDKYTQAQKDSVYLLLKKVREKKLAFARKALDEHRDDVSFLWVLDVYVHNFLTLDELEAELQKFSAGVQTTEKWQDKMDFVKYARLNQVGNKCIDFAVKGHDEKEIRLSELLKKHKLVLIDFWASWCKACRVTMPHLKEIYPQYKAKGVEFFSVSLDDKEEAWKKAYADEALPWIDGSNLLGWKDPIAKQYAIRGIPHKILIGSDGTIVSLDLNGLNAVEKAIDEYLAKMK